MPGLGGHLNRHQGQDLEDARPGRGSGRDTRLRLPEQVECSERARRASPTWSRRRSAFRMRSSKLEEQVVRARRPGAPGAVRRAARACGRTALERKTLAQTELQSLDTRVKELEHQQEALTENEAAQQGLERVPPRRPSTIWPPRPGTEAANGVADGRPRARDPGAATMRARASAVEELEKDSSASSGRARTTSTSCASSARGAQVDEAAAGAGVARGRGKGVMVRIAGKVRSARLRTRTRT